MERANTRAAVVVFVVGTALGCLAGPTRTLADDERRDRRHPSSPESAETRNGLHAFLRDTDLTLRLRAHYVDVQTVGDVEREALASGGWLAYRSGRLLETLQLGATLYAAAPVYAPPEKADTLLLAPGKEGYHVLGEAFVALGHGEYAWIKAYRHAIQQPYINRQDNAMTPNTFEGVTLDGRAGRVEYAAGYLARIKTRNADRFVPMSEAAGARGSNHGVAILGVKAKPLRRLEVTIGEQYGIDTFNTLFVQLEHVWPVRHDVRLQLGVQLSDQRAVGDALVATARSKEWVTRNGSARVALTYRELTLKIAASLTASGNAVQHPWGFYPGYLRMDQEQFENANERAFLVGVAYEPEAMLRGLTAFVNAGWGVESIDPVTRAGLGDESEYDLVVAYRPPAIKGLLFRGRALLYERDGAARVGSTLRFTINWEIPLLRPAGRVSGAEAGSP